MLARLEPPPSLRYEPLQLQRAGAQISGRAAGVRQWLCTHRLLVGLVLVGVVAGLAAAFEYSFVVVRQGKGSFAQSKYP